VEGFERGELSFFRLVRQILQSKSGIFGEKFNETSPIAKGLHRNKSIQYAKIICRESTALPPTNKV
jgi:hypothetical protein